MSQSAINIGCDAPGDPVRSRFMLKIFAAFAALAVLAILVNIGSKWLGAELILAGYTDDPTTREIVIGDNVIMAPANMIRFDRARRNGVAERLDIYLRWPLLDGYSKEARDDFNNADGRKEILFLSFEPQAMSRDMSGRYDPIYKSLIVPTGRPDAGGVTIYEFTKKSGYLNEVLAVAPRRGATPFVARCLSGQSADESLAPCERDIQIGNRLSLSYRFPRHLLGEWEKLDAAVTARAVAMLKTPR